MRQLRPLWLLLVAFGCSAPLPLEQSTVRRQDSIIGGAEDPGDPQVFLLDMSFDNAAKTICSATLITARTLVTAAHCVDPRRQPGAASVSIKATNRMIASQASTAELIDVTTTRLHPQWDPLASTSAQDIALLLLEAPVTAVAPKAFNRTALTNFTGRPLRVLGYGRTDPAVSNGGTRRVIELSATSVTSERLAFGTSGSGGICSGDSGGPSFHTFPDGVERIVGVHSYQTSPSCGDGADVRIDRFGAFIDQWFTDLDPAQCSGDGRCAQGCTPVDLDCVCGADGACTAGCPNLDLDPDCPKDCASNGVCALGTCPVADADCVPMGGACTNPLQCAGRSCASDPQHPATYCTRSCTGSTDCPSGMQCLSSTCALGQWVPAGMGDPCTAAVHLCVEGSSCTGPLAAATTCRPSCDSSGGCPEGSSCVGGQNGGSYCQASGPDEPLPGDETAEGGVGCRAAPGPFLGALALLLLVAARRGAAPRPGRHKAT